MPETEQAPVLEEELRTFVEVHVGPVGQVRAEALDVVDQGELVAEEVGGTLGPILGIGAIERDDAGSVGEATSATAPFARCRGCSPPRGCRPATW